LRLLSDDTRQLACIPARISKYDSCEDLAVGVVVDENGISKTYYADNDAIVEIDTQDPKTNRVVELLRLKKQRLALTVGLGESQKHVTILLISNTATTRIANENDRTK